jgi:signal peptidase I
VSRLEDAEHFQSEWPDRPAADPPKRDRRPFFRELPFLILTALVLAILVKTFLVQAFFIPSESMEPTLHGCPGCRGDRVLVNRLVYRFRDPRRGEVIVFGGRTLGEDTRSLVRKITDFLTEGLGVTRPSNVDYVKRIIGLPDETIEYRNGDVLITTVSGRRLKLVEPYIAERDDRPFGPFKVPHGEYFVMGDNRLHSGDSRYGLGTIARGDIIGKAFVKVWPPGRMGRIASVSYRGDPTAPGATSAILLGGGALVFRRRRFAGAGILDPSSANGGRAA